MTIQEAVQNIDNLISNSRLTRQEHTILQTNLNFLETRAKDAEELEYKEKPLTGSISAKIEEDE